MEEIKKLCDLISNAVTAKEAEESFVSLVEYINKLEKSVKFDKYSISKLTKSCRVHWMTTQLKCNELLTDIILEHL